MGHFDSKHALSLTLDSLKALMKSAGAEKLYCKHLACNDNSKNQAYFGPDLSSINIIPTGHIVAEDTTSKKPGAFGSRIFKAPVELAWITPSGQLHPAPQSKIIFYPQYPEARFSGFLRGSSADLGEWMDPNRKGRYSDRFLFLGVTNTRQVLAYLAVTGSTLSREMLASQHKYRLHGLFHEIPMQSDDSKSALLSALKAIHEKGWIRGTRLSNGSLIPCSSQNCGGYTLEAMLGISPNGYAEPDYLGWEVKQFKVSAFSKLDSSTITLMTPEPDGGVYVSEGVESFIRRFGYPDLNGREDRLNFGGVHRFSHRHPRTSLCLSLLGYSPSTGTITDAGGGIALLTESGEVAASWGFAKLIDHWKRKHNKAVYVPSLTRNDSDGKEYLFGSKVKLCEGTDFLHVLKSISSGLTYYDPGIKLENASSAPKPKRRSQFRIRSGNIDGLYDQVTTLDLNSPDFHAD